MAFVGVVAVAEHGFAAKMRPIMLQFALDVGDLRVTLIFLGLLGRVEIFVCHDRRFFVRVASVYQSRPKAHKKSVMLPYAFSFEAA